MCLGWTARTGARVELALVNSITRLAMAWRWTRSACMCATKSIIDASRVQVFGLDVRIPTHVGLFGRWRGRIQLSQGCPRAGRMQHALAVIFWGGSVHVHVPLHGPNDTVPKKVGNKLIAYIGLYTCYVSL